MPGVPRSQSLIRHRFTAGGTSPRFTCPAGYVTLVKSLYHYNSSTASQVVRIVVINAAGTVGPAADVGTVQASTVHAWSGWFVLNPGDYVVVSLDTGTGDCWLSGAILAGAPQFPPADGLREGITDLPEVLPA